MLEVGPAKRLAIHLALGVTFAFAATQSQHAMGQSSYTFLGASGSWGNTTVNNWGTTGFYPGLSARNNGQGLANDVAIIRDDVLNKPQINFNTSGAGVGSTLSLGTVVFSRGTGTAGVWTLNSSSQAGTLTLVGTTVNSISNTILSSAASSDWTISSGSGMSVTLTNTTNNVIQLNGSGNIVLSASINSAAAPLTFAGGGSGRIDITGSNTFATSGNRLNLTGPEVRFTNDASFGIAPVSAQANYIIIDGGRMATASASTYTLNANRGIQVGATAGTSISVVTSGTLTYNGIIADKTGSAGGWAKQGGGILALGGVNTYTGATAINSGTVRLTTGNDRLPTGTVVSLGQASSANLGTLDLNGFNQTIAGLNSTAGTNATASNNSVTSTAAATLTIGGSGTYSYGDGTNANSGVIGGAIAIVKTGTGTQTFGDANTFTGTTSINNGVLNVQHATALGATSAGTSVASGAALQIQGGITVGAEALTINGTGVGGTGALRNVSGLNSYGGLVTLGSSSQINSDAGSLSLTNAGTITGVGTSNLTVGGAGNTSIASVIGTGSGSLTKNDGGILTLSGANTYDGGTTVNGGTLSITSLGSLAAQRFTVESGATLSSTTSLLALTGTSTINGSVNAGGGLSLASGATLQGTGTITGATTINGKLFQANTSFDTIKNVGNVTWNDSTSNAWVFELGSSNASDLLDITGNFLKGTASADGKFTFDFANSTEIGTFTLVDWSGSTTFASGDFDFINLGGGNIGSFAVDVAGSRLNFTVSAVPEPTSMVLVGLVAVAGVAIRARRRKMNVGLPS